MLRRFDRRFFRYIAAACLVWALAAVPARAFDFADWDAALKKHVFPKTASGIRLNAVAYRELKQDKRFDALLAALKNFDTRRLKTREEKLAFWINTYNILTVKVVLDHYPIKSIKDAGGLFKSVWKIPAGTVGGTERTLNDIEHEILRKMDEPRIHAAIVCASVSCPDLRREAFTADRLESQLDDQMQAFLLNPQKGTRIDSAENRLYLSSIFNWFAADFAARGGVIAFVANYLPPDARKVLETRKLKLGYMDYDWSLNDLGTP